MNISGVGIDVVNIKRIERLLDQQPQRFAEKVYTVQEYDYATLKAKGNARALASILAARWAAKEAVAKALGTGFGRGLYWKNVEIISSGAAPQVVLHDAPEAFASAQFLLSISHDYPAATAIALRVK